MNKEQPEIEVSSNVSAENCGISACDTNSGSLDKFKDVKSLEEAYVNLQSEFTRKCQKLSALQEENSKILSENNSLKTESQKRLEPCYEKPEWNEYVKTFLENNSSALEFANDIMNVLLKDKVLASMPNSLELAFNKVKADKFKSEKEIISDQNFIENYVLNNENIKKIIIDEYLKQIKSNKSPQLINSLKTGSLGVMPHKKANSLSEAKEMVIKLFN